MSCHAVTNQNQGHLGVQALCPQCLRCPALQAQFDPATATRLQCGSELLSRSKKCFGFRMPPAAAG